MSDSRELHDDAPHQDWQGGAGDGWPTIPPKPEAGEYAYIEGSQRAGGESFKIRHDTASSSQAAPVAPGDEREAGYSEYHLTVPPLAGASLERLEACRRSLVIAYLGKGFSLREAGHIADIAVGRLQEWLEA